MPDAIPPLDNPTESLIPLASAGRTVGAGVTEGTLQTLAAMTLQPPDALVPGDGTAAASYILHRIIGAGGMGEVWEATQASLCRVVAVKRLRTGHSSPESIPLHRAQFRTEAAISARLQHPNIVPVYDLGLDDAGDPLMAMKLAEGTPWHRMLERDFGELDSKELLEKHLPILVAVTQAVAFAHANGVVHRDLKPAQVIVGEFGEVLLMDWGLALCMGDTQGSARSPRTRMELPTPESGSNPAGTPAMMAPEQTEPDARRVGPWTDVYLLGGTLYLLLTGTYPHQSKTSGESMRLAMRGLVTPPAERAPGRHIPADLEALCLKAMACDPDERVAGARAFLAALTDHLSGATRRRESEALCAEVADELPRARGAYDRYHECLAKLSRGAALWDGNAQIAGLRAAALEGYARAALANSDLLLARLQAQNMAEGAGRSALMADVHAAMGRQQRAARQRRLAIAASFALLAVVILGGAAFTHRLRQSLDETEAQRALLLARLEGAGGLVDYMLGELRTNLDLENEHDRQISAAVASGVSKYYRDTKLDGFSRDLLVEHSRQLRRVGDRFKDLEIYDEAEWIIGQAIDVASMVPDDPAAVALSRAGLGQLMWEQGKPEGYDVLHEARLEMERHGYGEYLVVTELLGAESSMLASMDRIDESLDVAMQAIERSRRVAGEKSDALAGSLHAAGFALSVNGDPHGALEYYRQSLAVREAMGEGESESAAATINNMAAQMGRLGLYADTIPLYEKARDIYARNSGPESRNVANAVSNIANSLGSLGRHQESVAMEREALRMREALLGPDHPVVLIGLGNLAAGLRQLGQIDEALAMQAGLVPRMEAAFGETHYAFSGLLINMSVTMNSVGRAEEAVPIIQRAVDIIESSPNKNALATAYLTLADSLSLTNRPQEAREAFVKALETNIAIQGPDHPDTAYAYANLGQFEKRQGNLAEAVRLGEEALRIRVAALGPDHPETAFTLMNLGDTYGRVGRKDEGVAALRRALATLKETRGPESYEAGMAAGSLAVALLQNGGDGGETIALAKRAYDVLERTRGPANKSTLQHRINFGSTLQEYGRNDEAAAVMQLFIEDWPAENPDAPKVNLIDARDRLTMALTGLGCFDEAEEEAIKLREAIGRDLGTDHAAMNKAWARQFANRLAWLAVNDGDPAAFQALAEEFAAQRPLMLKADSGKAAWARALVRMGRTDEALPLVWDLLNAEYRDAAFWIEMRGAGLPAPEAPTP